MKDIKKLEERIQNLELMVVLLAQAIGETVRSIGFDVDGFDISSLGTDFDEARELLGAKEVLTFNK